MSTLNLTAGQLRDVLTPVLPLAGKDDMLPVLTCVHLRTEGQTLIASATDRFRLGICREELVHAPEEPFEALVRVKDLKRILTLFKVTRFDNPALRLTVKGETLRVASTEGFGGMAAAELTFTLMGGEYPKVNQLITAAIEDTEPRVEAFGVNAAMLADFKHAVRYGDALMVRPGSGPRKGILVLCGDHFVGLIMPRALLSHRADEAPPAAWPLPAGTSWTALFAEKAGAVS